MLKDEMVRCKMQRCLDICGSGYLREDLTFKMAFYVFVWKRQHPEMCQNFVCGITV